MIFDSLRSFIVSESVGTMRTEADCTTGKKGSQISI